MKPRFVIYERSPRRRLVKLVLLGALLGVAAYFGSEYGRVDAAGDISRTTAERNVLRQRVDTMSRENAELREKTAILERHSIAGSSPPAARLEAWRFRASSLSLRVRTESTDISSY